jgi:hypothetical protein
MACAVARRFQPIDALVREFRAFRTLRASEKSAYIAISAGGEEFSHSLDQELPLARQRNPAGLT